MSLVALGLADAAVGDTPFQWSMPTLIGEAGAPVNGVSCASPSFCVAAAGAGDILTSTDPSAPSSWPVTHVDGDNSISAVSCASLSLCVAVDGAGDMLTSTEPTVQPPTWTMRNVDLSGPISDVSCVASTFCVAVDHRGNVLTSTDPTEPSTWESPVKIDKNPRTESGANVIWGVSCASESLCVAVDSAGNVLTSTDPTAKSATWRVSSVEGDAIYGVSCPSESLCVAVDAGGNVVSSTDPNAPSPTWTVTYHVDTHQLYGISCVRPSTCVAVDSAGNVVSSTEPAEGASAWTVTSVDSPQQLYGVSCVSLSLCVAVDDTGNGLIGSPAPPHTLSVSLAGSGAGVVTGPEVDCPGTCSQSYPNGRSVSLSAAPAGGSTFAGWSGACAGTGTCTVTLSSDQAVSATFTAKPSGGSVNGGSGGVGSGKSAAAVNLTVAGSIESLADGGVGMPMRCWAKAGSCVPATLDLVVIEKLRGRKVTALAARLGSKLRRRSAIVGSATVSLSAGQSATVDVHLNATGSRLLAQYRKLPASLRIVSQHGQTLWKQAVTILRRAPGKKGKRE
jgi:hypothetical protein